MFRRRRYTLDAVALVAVTSAAAAGDFLLHPPLPIHFLGAPLALLALATMTMMVITSKVMTPTLTKLPIRVAGRGGERRAVEG